MPAEATAREKGSADATPLTPDLLEAAERGEEAAWKTLFDDLYPRIYRLCRAYAASEALAEQVASDVFLEAYRSVPRLRGSETPFPLWLCGLARTALARHGIAPPGEPGAQTFVHDEFLAEDIRIPLRALPAASRAALELRFVVGLSVAEAAAVMGCSADWLRSVESEALGAFAAASGGGTEPRRGSAA